LTLRSRSSTRHLRARILPPADDEEHGHERSDHPNHLQAAEAFLQDDARENNRTSWIERTERHRHGKAPVTRRQQVQDVGQHVEDAAPDDQPLQAAPQVKRLASGEGESRKPRSARTLRGDERPKSRLGFRVREQQEEEADGHARREGVPHTRRQSVLRRPRRGVIRVRTLLPEKHDGHDRECDARADQDGQPLAAEYAREHRDDDSGDRRGGRDHAHRPDRQRAIQQSHAECAGDASRSTPHEVGSARRRGSEQRQHRQQREESSELRDGDDGERGRAARREAAGEVGGTVEGGRQQRQDVDHARWAA